MYYFLTISIIISAFFGLIGCGNQEKSFKSEDIGSKPSQSDEQKLEKIKILLDWKPGAEHAFLYAGKNAGFFLKQGIDLEIVAGTGSSSSANMIDAKNVDFALCSGETALQARGAETPREVTVLAVFYPNTPTVIYSLKNTRILKAVDLYGKRLGIMKGSSAYRNYKAFAKKIGLDRSRIKEMPSTGDLREIIGEGAPLDAMVHFGFQHPLQLRLKGYEVSEIRIRDFGIQIYGQSLITHKDTIKNRPNLVHRMTSAVQKSYRLSLLNPEEALNVFFNEIPGQDEEYARKKLEWVNDFVRSGIPKGKPIGFQSIKGWLSTLEYLKDQGFIIREINIDDVWTNQFLDNSVVTPLEEQKN